MASVWRKFPTKYFIIRWNNNAFNMHWNWLNKTRNCQRGSSTINVNRKCHLYRSLLLCHLSINKELDFIFLRWRLMHREQIQHQNVINKYWMLMDVCSGHGSWLVNMIFRIWMPRTINTRKKRFINKSFKRKKTKLETVQQRIINWKEDWILIWVCEKWHVEWTDWLRKKSNLKTQKANFYSEYVMNVEFKWKSYDMHEAWINRNSKALRLF